VITGRSHFNEVLLTDVVIPYDQVIGAPGEGWRLAIATLMYERVSVQGSATRGGRHAQFDRLLAEARRRGLTGDATLRQQLADLYICENLLFLGARRARALSKAGGDPGPAGSVGKLAAGVVAARFRDLLFRVCGPAAAAWTATAQDGAVWSELALDSFMMQIAGGTTEIQRNIVAERVLGLPKEPALDRNRPFREVRNSGPQTRSPH
jgi:alkylation response protein AidB-like acyl-CoA dehydrogenase